MKKSQSVTLPLLFKLAPLGIAGIEKIADEAQHIVSTPYGDDSKYPANIHALSLQILSQARHCLSLIDSGDSEQALMAGFELGNLCERANKLLAVWENINQKKAERQKYVDAADAKNSRLNDQRRRTIEEWIAREPHRRGDKKQFSYDKAEETGVSKETIYDKWLSRSSIEDFRS